MTPGVTSLAVQPIFMVTNHLVLYRNLRPARVPFGDCICSTPPHNNRGGISLVLVSRAMGPGLVFMALGLVSIAMPLAPMALGLVSTVMVLLSIATVLVSTVIGLVSMAMGLPGDDTRSVATCIPVHNVYRATLRLLT